MDEPDDGGSGVRRPGTAGDQAGALRRPPAPGAHEAAARSLLLDVRAGQLSAHLAEHGVASLVLKGPVVAAWLYADGTPRPYGDIDLLVAPADLPRAVEALGLLGFRPWMAGAHWSELAAHEVDLVADDGTWVDLHTGLVGIPRAQADRAWATFHGTRVPMTVGFCEVDVLAEPARLLHVALHAAQNGVTGRKSLQDLERGLRLAPLASWQAAARIAHDLEAVGAFSTGLRLLPAGEELADRLGVDQAPGLETALRAMSAPESARSLARLLALDSGRERLSALWHELWPSRAALHAWRPDLAGNRWGHLVVRLTRPAALAARLVRALWWVARASRAGRGARGGADASRAPRD